MSPIFFPTFFQTILFRIKRLQKLHASPATFLQFEVLMLQENSSNSAQFRGERNAFEEWSN